MANDTGTAGRYTREFVVDAWRITDPAGNRIGTCYDETNAVRIVTALNASAIRADALRIIRAQAQRLKEFGKHAPLKISAAAVSLAGAAIEAAADALEGLVHAVGVVDLEPGRAELRREGALESDPYAVGRYSFADLVHDCHALDRDADLSETVVLRVRDRVFDDVHASHRMLDALGIAGGTLTARIGIALGWKVLERETRENHSGAGEVIINGRRGPALIADADSVKKVPDPDRVLELLDRLSGEELFRLFDAVKVLPANTNEARDWNLMDADDTRRMVATCCAIALEAGKLGELAKAAGDMIERAARLK